ALGQTDFRENVWAKVEIEIPHLLRLEAEREPHSKNRARAGAANQVKTAALAFIRYKPASATIWAWLNLSARNWRMSCCRKRAAAMSVSARCGSGIPP